MVIIAITGIASTLARAVVPRLLSEASVEKIVGVDIRKPDYFSSDKLEFHQADVRDFEGLKRAIGKIDILLHLAFIVFENVPDRQTIDAINIGGSKNAFQAALAGGARKIIHLSSVAAYGLSTETSSLITEEEPLRGAQNNEFYYPYTKAMVEGYLNAFEKENPQICVTRFRPHVIAGPQFASHTGNLGIILNPLRKGKTGWTITPKHADRLLLQLTHEEDLAEAILLAVKQDLPGAFNIASLPLDHAGFMRQKGLKVHRIPWGVVGFAVGLGGLFSKRVRQLKSWATGIKYLKVMSSEKLKSQGFRFKYPTSDAIIEDALKSTN